MITPEQLNLGGLEQQYGLPSGLLAAVMKQESAGNPDAASARGAQGIFQFMPDTAKQYGINPLDPSESAVGAARMYSDLSKQYNGDVPSMLAAYNWGSGNLNKYGLANAPQETRDYINKIAPQVGQQYTQADTGTMTDADPQNITPDMAQAELDRRANSGTVTPEMAQAELTRRNAKQDSFAGDVRGNFDNAISSAKQLASGDFEDIGRGNIRSPKLAALADKLMPQGSDGSFGSAVANMGNTSARDWSGALLEKFGATPEGKALSVMGGVIPSFNLVGAAVNRYANPAIESATGIAPENLQLAEMVLGALGLKGASEAQLPEATLGKTASSQLAKLGETSGVPVNAASLGLTGLAANIGSDVKAAFSKSPAEDAQTFKAQSQDSYKQMRDAGAELNRAGTGSVTYGIGKALADSGIMNKSLHGDTMSIVQDLNDAAQNGSLSLEKLDQYRQLLNQAVSKNTSKVDGANPDAFKANVAIGALDDAVNNLGPEHITNPAAIDSLNNARAQWAKSSRMSQVQKIIDNAKMTDNPVTAMKTGFKNLSKSLKVSPRGWTPDEISAVNDAAKTGILTNALRVAGSRLTPMIAGGAGYASGGPVGALAAAGTEYAISGTARALANKIQTGKANNVLGALAPRPQIPTNPFYKPTSPALSALAKFATH